MNFISITTPTADINGALLFKPTSKSDFRTLTSRTSRSQALDGTAIVTNQGVSDGDRTLNIRAYLSETDAEKLWTMFKTYPYLQVAIDDGVFYGAISRLSINRGEVSIDFLIQE